MDITRTLAAGALGLVLLTGAAGCGAVAEEAGERIAEEAVEQNSDCSDVEIDSEGGFSGTCGGDQIDVDASGDAGLPDAWPAELAPPDRAQVITSTDTDGSLALTYGLDGEVAAVADEVKAQLEAAGYTIDDDTAAQSAGSTSASVSATGPEYSADVVITDVQNAVEGNITVVYTLLPA